MTYAFFSHFSLLLGCALPIWLSSGNNDRPLSPFSGILSLGIGDTMVSLLTFDEHDRSYTHSLLSCNGFTFISRHQLLGTSTGYSGGAKLEVSIY